MQSLCVFCGSSDAVQPAYLQAAAEMGGTAARRGIRIVFGGGSTGLMGALARAALKAEGEVIGVIPEHFNRPGLADAGWTRLEVVATMHQRKARMAALADGFVALPGGFGTLEELFEVLTWAQVGLHAKPIGLLNAGGYFDPLLRLIEHAEAEGFIYTEHRRLITTAHHPEALLDGLETFQPPDGLERWLDRSPKGRGRPGG